MSEMKFVESVKVGDRVRVEGFGINQTPNGREPAVLQGQVARIAWCSADWCSADIEGWACPVVNVHLRNIVEIVECGEGNHEWKSSCSVEPHTQCKTDRLCTRCGKREEPKPEPVCWCGMYHPFQPERRKGERRVSKLTGFDYRGKDKAIAEGTLVRFVVTKAGDDVNLRWFDLDQRGTLPDRRKGGAK